jgi:hypothetical protein
VIFKFGYTMSALTGLSSNKLEVLEGVRPTISYTLSESGMRITIAGAIGAKYVLPLIAGELKMMKGAIERQDEIFFLTGGFIAQEYTLIPNASGEIELIIS